MIPSVDLARNVVFCVNNLGIQNKIPSPCDYEQLHYLFKEEDIMLLLSINHAVKHINI